MISVRSAPDVIEEHFQSCMSRQIQDYKTLRIKHFQVPEGEVIVEAPLSPHR